MRNLQTLKTETNLYVVKSGFKVTFGTGWVRHIFLPPILHSVFQNCKKDFTCPSNVFSTTLSWFLYLKVRIQILELGRWLSGWSVCSASMKNRVHIPAEHVSMPVIPASESWDLQSMLASKTSCIGGFWIWLSSLAVLGLYMHVHRHAKNKHA